MSDARQVNAHYVGMSSMQEREKPLAEDRRGIDIDTTVQARQSAILAGNEDLRFIDAFSVVAQHSYQAPAKCLCSDSVDLRIRYSESQLECRA